jgi:hypothetical protein
MLTLKKIFSSTALILLAFGLTACASSYQRSAPAPIDYKARYLFDGYKNFNLSDQECSGNSGSAIYGNMTDATGVGSDYQKAEAWNTCGTPLDDSARSRLREQPEGYNRQPQYSPQPRYDNRQPRYDSRRYRY